MTEDTNRKLIQESQKEIMDAVMQSGDEALLGKIGDALPSVDTIRNQSSNQRFSKETIVEEFLKGSSLSPNEQKKVFQYLAERNS